MNPIKQTIRGSQIITEWLGDGGQVVSVLNAESRAQICATCPKNVKGNWIDRLKKEAADVIREHLSVKNGFGLVLSTEKEIGFCSQCGCCLSLKVWVPTEHVRHHTPQHEVSEYPDFCWVRKELTEV
jgi:hypothetical protein